MLLPGYAPLPQSAFAPSIIVLSLRIYVPPVVGHGGSFAPTMPVLFVYAGVPPSPPVPSVIFKASFGVTVHG